MENQNNGSESSFNFSSSSAVLHFPLVSNNSFEINAISLSDDSGFTSSQLNRENDVRHLRFFPPSINRRKNVFFRYINNLTLPSIFSMPTSTRTSLRNSRNSTPTRASALKTFTP